MFIQAAGSVRGSTQVVNPLERKCFEYTKQYLVVTVSMQFQQNDLECYKATIRLSVLFGVQPWLYADEL